MMKTNYFRAVPGGSGAAVRLRLLSCIALLSGLVVCRSLQAAELSVADLQMRPNVYGFVIVSGAIEGESTFGLTIMLELTPRPGNKGTLAFSPVDSRMPLGRGSFSIRSVPGRGDEVRVAHAVRREVDIVQLRDPWPDLGTFSVFDTDESGSVVLNGAVDDNGTFVAGPITFSGPLAAFPIKAGPNASGVWDVVLFTNVGTSNWEGLSTELHGGTITITRAACVHGRQCNDGDPCTVDVCKAGVCTHEEKRGRCRGREGEKNRGHNPGTSGRGLGED